MPEARIEEARRLPQKIAFGRFADNQIPNEVQLSPIRLERWLHDWRENDMSMLERFQTTDRPADEIERLLSGRLLRWIRSLPS